MAQERRILHFNKPQLKAHIVNARKFVGVMGRGTGKSEGIIAPKVANNIHAMPRAAGAFVGATYAQLLTRTLPPVIAGLERLGYQQGVHFVFGKKPLKHFEIPRKPPLKWENAMAWYNGSYVALVSQDRPGSANGLSLAWAIGDEAKFLDKEKYYSELLPAIRGDRHLFDSLSEYRSTALLTDMPTTTRSRWILDMKSEQDDELIRLIMLIETKLQELRSKGKTTGRTYKELSEKVVALRKNAVHFLMASTLDNVDVLGMEYIHQLKRDLPSLIFMSSVLNIDIKKGEGESFYPSFEELSHCYAGGVSTELANAEFDFNRIKGLTDCLLDDDLIMNEPLDIALDYGRFNCLVVGQHAPGNTYRILRCFWVNAPSQLKDLVQLFTTHYRLKLNRQVNYIYDHTAVAFEPNGLSYCDEVIHHLKEGGFHVNEKYIGKAPSHNVKYLFFQKLYGQTNSRWPLVHMNRIACDPLVTSIDNSGVRQGKNGFEKDKRAEQDPNAKQEETTHLSDAHDTLLFGMFHPDVKEQSRGRIEPTIITY